jgi:6-phosphogluconolactonase
MPTSRRHFLAASAALPFAVRSLAATPPAPRWVLLGTNGKSIDRAPWNPATGTLGAIESAATGERPNFLALHPRLPVVYAVNSGSASAASFHLDAATGTLTQTSRVSSIGDGPCAVSVDRSGRLAFVANYTGGSFAAFRLRPSGDLGDAVATLDCRNNPACGSLGPNKDRQDTAHIHCVTVAPGNDFVLACNLGEDAIELFELTPGSPTPVAKPLRISARPGSGPRHVAFHPNSKWLYCVHELDCTVDLYDWNPRAAFSPLTLRPNSAVSSLEPGGSLTGNTGCEVFISDNGRFLYTCIRGLNILVVYIIDSATGLLTEQQRLSCGGAVPRYFTLDPSRHWLLCANQGSSTVTVFAHNPATGHITETPQTFPTETPMFFQFV